MSSTTHQLVTVHSPDDEELTVKSLNKRYQGLLMIRTKAINGKGAWYWAHFEPSLLRHPDTGRPESVKLRCSLCSSLFSASNPSRTATEHLKRGTCPNFNSDPGHGPGQNPNPVVSSRKRRGGARPVSCPTRPEAKPGPETAYSVAPITMIEPVRFSVDGSYPNLPGSGPGFSSATVVHFQPQQSESRVVLSGGKEDLGALRMLEDSVKKLKSPKALATGQVLTRAQIDSSVGLLADWVFENCGSVSVSSLDHPKFKSFLNHVGLAVVNPKEFVGPRLDVKYNEAKMESEARIRDALFFQISSNGWKSNDDDDDDDNNNNPNLVNLCVNLPNGTSVFRRGVFTSGYVFSKHAEDILWETICDICENNLEQCVGIVSDKFNAKALRNLENKHHWMINLCCQLQGVSKLIEDFSKELPLFNNVVDTCYKVGNFVNTKSLVRHSFLKYQLQEYGRAALVRVPVYGEVGGFEPVFQMVEDVLSSSRALQLVFLDESCKMVSMENNNNIGKEIEEMMMSRFWNELDAVHSLVGLIKGMAREIEREKPRVGQCLPLWEELRVKIKEWCVKYHVNENHVEKVFDKRFRRNYHPAWSAAFVLDPFYMIPDTSGKYLPPFKCLTSEQEKDVGKLITRLVSREEAHIVLMELMKWRTEGLDPMYAQAVQLKQRDPITGKMKVANPQSSRLVWEAHLTEFKCLRKVAMRLIFLHATSFGFKWNSSIYRWAQSRAAIDKAQKLIFIAAQSKLERRDFSNDEEKDAEFFSFASREDDVLNDDLFDASSL
ncbi:uncharacterized protein LOC143586357 [Bidens hawaiensis]|uniref:uncharacterized protein LOC143586357 n=1 Tax=Bidens hawaiensis TaxID=980011 RepID=UPI004049F73F